MRGSCRAMPNTIFSRPGNPRIWSDSNCQQLPHNATWQRQHVIAYAVCAVFSNVPPTLMTNSSKRTKVVISMQYGRSRNRTKCIQERQLVDCVIP
eukprot:1302419-Amphidinium_carterae.1